MVEVERSKCGCVIDTNDMYEMGRVDVPVFSFQ